MFDILTEWKQNDFIDQELIECLRVPDLPKSEAIGCKSQSPWGTFVVDLVHIWELIQYFYASSGFLL